jgi:serine/threonine protein kinase
VKPSNILLSCKSDSAFFCIAKLTDFGFAEQEIQDQSIGISELPRGTMIWAVPEQERGDIIPVNLIHGSGVWGCGMTVWSIVALRGQVPTMSPEVATIDADFRGAIIPEDLHPELLSASVTSLCPEVSRRQGALVQVGTKRLNRSYGSQRSVCYLTMTCLRSVHTTLNLTKNGILVSLGFRIFS